MINLILSDSIKINNIEQVDLYKFLGHEVRTRDILEETIKHTK